MSNTAPCTICKWNDQIINGIHPSFVQEMETGYVILAEHQYFKGYSLFLSKKHAAELHDLTNEERMTFLKEMSLVSQAVANAFKPVKLNYELLGNLTPHLHWHIIPRYKTDAHPEKSIWELDKQIIFNNDTIPDVQERNQLIKMLQTAIKQVV